MYFIQEICQECLHDKLFCSLGVILFFLLGWIIAGYVRYYIRDNFGLEEKKEICEIVEKYEWKNENMDVNYYSEYGLYIPFGFLSFVFYINGEKIEHEVPLSLRDMEVGQPVVVTYEITRLSKKIKVKKVEAAHHPCKWL